MMQKIGGIAVLVGLILAVVGSLLVNENLRMTGILILLFTATIAGYRFIKFSITVPTMDVIGTCVDKKQLTSYYIISFRTGNGVISGQASLKNGSSIEIGEKAKLKVKGPLIIEINKI